MSKLTARLSDGRELDVCSEWHAKEDDYTMIVAKPKEQPQPREWWHVKARRDGKTYGAYSSFETATKYLNSYNSDDRKELEVVHVREVLP
jgi:hypothetical protein